jgi:hypothetical protein
VDPERWANRVLPSDNAEELIRKFKPPLANIKSMRSGLYGGFKVEYDGAYVRTYNWTGRGPTLALKLSLRLAWKQVTDKGAHFPRECQVEIDKINVDRP